MRSLRAFLFFIGMFNCVLRAQTIEPFGLEGKTVTALHFYGAARLLYAATENEGVFRRDLSNDSGWVSLHIPAQQLHTIYAFHTYCPLKCWKGVLAGATRNEAAGDSALIYFYQQRPDTCPQPGEWQPADSGLPRAVIPQINAITGSAVCQPNGEEFVTAFAGGPEFIGRSLDRGGSWQAVWQQPRTNILALASMRRSSLRRGDESIWAGGYIEASGAHSPLISCSFDFGETWQDRSPANFSGEECRAPAIDRADTNFIAAALSTNIILSKDGGRNWVAAELPDLIVQLHALVLNPATAQHILAGGALSGQNFLLYESFDGGEQWHTVAPPAALHSVSSLAFDPALPRDTPMPQTIYIGTRGSGVYRYTLSLTNVAENPRHAPRAFQLSPTFPNPSAAANLSSLSLRVRAPHADEMRVRLLNVLGQEVSNWRVRVAHGEQFLRLPLDQTKLKTGVYFIHAAWRNETLAVKWTIVP